MTDERKQDRNNDAPALKPDPETLHTTDPQENMQGPVSSLMQGAGEAFDSGQSKKEADEEKDKNM